jgi:hypothetical protein
MAVYLTRSIEPKSTGKLACVRSRAILTICNIFSRRPEIVYPLIDEIQRLPLKALYRHQFHEELSAAQITLERRERILREIPRTR